ncbi:MAG TPA: GDP-L-fucose synthase [Kineosporiaceae bacterium]|nr:GDP-L-fucose synthase [Kineosporiaceae bacterium]
MTTRPLRRNSRIYVAGHRGLVGSAVWRHLEARGCTNLIGAPSSDLDLRDDGAVDAFFAVHQPEVVVLAAARVGGILANATRPADFLGDNLRIQVNVLEAAHRAGVDRLLFLGSSCVYPKFAPQPIPERALLTGILEPTNDAYAIAKIAGLLHVQAMRRQHGHRWISAMPTNLYGPGDSFDLASSHVLPAMIRKFSEAKSGGGPVVLWGSGAPRREFLHVDDLAAACVFLLEHYDGDEHVNVGAGRDITIAELTGVVADVVGYDGPVTWDVTKPDGTPRKLLDTSKITSLGWRPAIGLRAGIQTTYTWFLERHGAVRGVV